MTKNARIMIENSNKNARINILERYEQSSRFN